MGGHKELVQTGQSNRSVTLVAEVNTGPVIASDLGVIAFDALKNVHRSTTGKVSSTAISSSVSNSGMSLVLWAPLAITNNLIIV